jgi:hypothetical protein
MGSHQSAKMISDVWLTPPEILAALGHFDLDPCAPADRPWNMAARHYTPADDGLSQPWAGRVWLNPPYGREAVKWLRRLAKHGQGTALTFARTETRWFWETVWRATAARGALFFEGRLYFHRQNGERAAANAGAPSVLVAYGADDAWHLARSGLAGAYVELPAANVNGSPNCSTDAPTTAPEK